MLQDLLRFYRSATRDAQDLRSQSISLGDYLDAGGYGRAFRDDHLLPMAGAIWSAPCAEILSYPRKRLHPLPQQSRPVEALGRPAWRTVVAAAAPT